MSWPVVKLHDICRPKQWKTIAASNLLESGYPVYGANGKIGFYSEFTHESPTLMITCRGATCGNVHISEPKSYINGNAMALDDMDSSAVDLKYLYYFFLKRGFDDVISGSAQPQITGQGLTKVEIPLPPLAEQKRIAAILDKADAIRCKRQQAIQLADEFLRSVFLDMFGDPASNPKGWKVKPLKKMADVITGNTPSRSVEEYYGGHLEWIKSDNINTPSHILTTASEYLSEGGASVGRIVPEGSTLITCIAGSFDCIGNASYADREVAFNQQINALIPKQGVDSWFLYALILFSKKLIQAASTNSMKGMVSKGKLEQVEIIDPPKSLQIEFSKRFESIRELSNKNNFGLEVTSLQFASLQKQAFSGQL